MDSSSRHWTVFFFLAAAFNFSMGGPIFFASAWSCSVAYTLPPDAATLRLRGDFGDAVLLTGLGYAILALDIDRNHGIVWFPVRRPATP